MHNDYEDIVSQVGREPDWWDGNGTPRFKPFHPKLLPDISAREAALLEIACQACGHRFLVAISFGPHDMVLHHMANPGAPMKPMRDNIRDVGYGDPPNIGCCAAGPTMTSDTLRVVEYWQHEDWRKGWVRDPRYEILIDEELIKEAKNAEIEPIAQEIERDRQE